MHLFKEDILFKWLCSGLWCVLGTTMHLPDTGGVVTWARQDERSTYRFCMKSTFCLPCLLSPCLTNQNYHMLSTRGCESGLCHSSSSSKTGCCLSAGKAFLRKEMTLFEGVSVLWLARAPGQEIWLTEKWHSWNPTPKPIVSDTSYFQLFVLCK